MQGDLYRDLLAEHRNYFGKESNPVRVAKLSAGDVIKFDYHNKMRYVMVLNPKWEDKLHGLTLQAVPHRMIPRLLKEITVRKPPVMYRERVRKNNILYFDAYRTYNITQMIDIKKVEYLKNPGPSTGK